MPCGVGGCTPGRAWPEPFPAVSHKVTALAPVLGFGQLGVGWYAEMVLETKLWLGMAAGTDLCVPRPMAR